MGGGQGKKIEHPVFWLFEDILKNGLVDIMIGQFLKQGARDRKFIIQGES